MKKLLLYVLAVIVFAACTNDAVKEQSAFYPDAPETITVGFEGDDETRIQLNEAQKTVWTEGDLVSVFYFSDANQKWQFQGETGDRIGNLKRVNAGAPTRQTTFNVVAYPYNEDYFLSTRTGALHATLPATQHYLKDSYGVGDNLMVARSEFTQFSLKSVCGWLKLQLAGEGEVVKSITFRGNNGEQVAGLVYVDTATAEATLASEMGSADDNNAGGNLVFDDTIFAEVTLDCGEGVTLGAEATAFYIALPPQTFENGFTVEVKCIGYEPMTISTDNSISLERNHIQPMKTVEFEAEESSDIPNNEIWYTATEQIWPNNEWDFGVTLINNYYDDSTGDGILEFDGELTRIPNEAFYDCGSLTSVNIPDSVTTIGDGAFAYCDSLTSVNIPDSVTTIGSSAFYNCYRLISVTIGDSVTTIGDRAFIYCYSLTSVNIPDSVTEIGYFAFNSCDSLTSVTIGDSVTTIGGGAFASCGSLTEFTGKFAEDNGRILIIDGVLTAFAPAGITQYTIPDSVTTIGYATFEDCDSLTSVTIPDSVTTIGEAAFWGCESLTSVTIGDSVTTIGERAFYWCSSLTSVTIPDSVTTIGNSAFYRCTSLTSVNIPDSVTAIGDYAFIYCDSLKEFKGKFASEDGRSLIVDNTIIAYANASGTTYTIPDSVTSIGMGAFASCTSLTSVNIPDRVTTIGNYAFEDCDSLTSVYCKATTPPALGDLVFGSHTEERLIYVPVESLDAYLNAEGWRDYADYIVGYDFETGEITKPSINLGICGTMTNWGQDGILDIEMVYLEDRNLYVAYGVELTTDDSFKLRSNNNWNSRYNIGARYYGSVAYPNFMEELINDPDSHEICVAENGTYDIYINLDSMVLYFMVEGADPDTASDMDDVEWISMGYGTYVDDFFWVVTGQSELVGAMAEVEFQQHPYNPNRIRVVNAFSPDVIMQLYGVIPEWYKWNGVDNYLEFDISNPDNVRLANDQVPLGFQLDLAPWRDIYFASLSSYNIKLEDGVINFTPQSIAFAYFYNGQLTGWYANQYGRMQYVLPGYEPKDYSFSAQYAGSDENNFAYFDMEIGKDIDKFAVAVVEGNADVWHVANEIINGTAENIIEFSGDQQHINIELAPGLYTFVAVPYSNGEPREAASVVFFHEGDGSFEAPELEVELKVDIVANFFPEEWDLYNEQFPGWYCYGFYVKADRPEYIEQLRVANCSYDVAHVDGEEISNQRIEEILAQRCHIYSGSFADGSNLDAHNLNSTTRECIVMAVDTYYGTTQYYHIDYDVPAKTETRSAATYATLKSVVYNAKAAKVVNKQAKPSKVQLSKPNLSNVARF